MGKPLIGITPYYFPYWGIIGMPLKSIITGPFMKPVGFL